jgi:hypothetical protein
MTVYQLKEGEELHTGDSSAWEPVAMDPLEAIKKLSGKRALMLMWEEDKLLHSITIRTRHDDDILERQMERVLCNVIKSLANGIR